MTSHRLSPAEQSLVILRSFNPVRFVIAVTLVTD